MFFLRAHTSVRKKGGCILKFLDEWAKNYRILLTCNADTDGLAATMAAYQAAEAWLRILPKAQQRVLRLRYLEGASWDGVGKLMNMRTDWARKTAETAIGVLKELGL